MTTLSLSPLSCLPCGRPPAVLGEEAAPSAKPANPDKYEETWANGIHHVHDGKVDQYDLPATQPGIPAHITRTRRFLLPAKVEATDIEGKKLHADMGGFPCNRKVHVVNADGVTTDLSVKNHDVTVKTPEVQLGCKHSGIVVMCYSRTDAEQTLQPDGTVEYHADQFKERMFCQYGNSSRDLHETLVTFPRDGEPQAARIPRDGWLPYEPRVATKPDAEGRFTITNPATGEVKAHQVFLMPH